MQRLSCAGFKRGVVMPAALLVLSSCGGGGMSVSGTTSGTNNTTVTITPFKGRFSQGSLVQIRDASGNLVSLSGAGVVGANGTGVVGADGTTTVSFASSVAYPLTIEVSGTYYNEVTGLNETSPTPLRAIVDVATSGVAVTAVTEMAAARAYAQLGVSPSTTNPLTLATAQEAVQVAEQRMGWNAGQAKAIPVFDSNGKTNDPYTLQLAALAVAANQNSGVDLADKLAKLSSTLAALPALSSVSVVLSSAELQTAWTAVTSGRSSMLSLGSIPPATPTIFAPVPLSGGAAGVTVTGGLTGGAITNAYCTSCVSNAGNYNLSNVNTASGFGYGTSVGNLAGSSYVGNSSPPSTLQLNRELSVGLLGSFTTAAPVVGLVGSACLPPMTAQLDAATGALVCK